MLAWGLIATLLFPLTLLMYVEAGRYGAKGLVRWPVLVPGMMGDDGREVDQATKQPTCGKNAFPSVSRYYPLLSTTIHYYPLLYFNQASP